MPKACVPIRHCGFLLWKNCHLFRAEREKVSINSTTIQIVSEKYVEWVTCDGVGHWFSFTTVELKAR